MLVVFKKLLKIVPFCCLCDAAVITMFEYTFCVLGGDRIVCFEFCCCFDCD